MLTSARSTRPRRVWMPPQPALLLLVGAAAAAPSAAAACECPSTYPYCWSTGTQHDNRCYKSESSSSYSGTACVGSCTTSYVPAPAPPPAPPVCECPSTYPYCWSTGTQHDNRCYKSESSSSYSGAACAGSCTTSYVPPPIPTLPPVPPGQVAPMCDRRRMSPDEYCEAFCTYKCGFYNTSAGETGKPQNITVIRITPKNVTGPADKNTADAPGDVSFVLSKKNLTQMCLHYPTALGCNTDVEVNDMYGTFVLEVDGQWGPYQMCNPADGYDTKAWKCGQNCMRPTHRGCGEDPYHPPQNGSTYNGGVQCYCDRTARAVGREPAPRSYRPYGLPAAWPPQCATGVYKPPRANTVVTGTVLRSLPAWDFASASTIACKECGDDAACTGWAINRTDGWAADLFQGRVGTRTKFGAGAADSATKYQSSHHHYSGASWSGVGDIGGVWYSHTSAGECPAGAPLGTNGCTWRVVATLAYKNATCVDLKADAAVVAHGKACFDACPQPLRRDTDCYLDCYRNTLLGDASLNITQPPSSLIVDPWRDALESAESAGGCPDIQPGPLSA